MKFGKIIGQVIAPQKVDNLKGLKLVIVQYLDEKLKPLEKTATCVDSVNANLGDVVLTVSSSSARLTKFTKNVCTDNTIVGVVDQISFGKKIYIRKVIYKT